MQPVDIGSVEVENLIMEFANLLCCCYLSTWWVQFFQLQLAVHVLFQ